MAAMAGDGRAPPLQRAERARARWRILANALSKSSSGVAGNVQPPVEASVSRRLSGVFNLIPCKKLSQGQSVLEEEGSALNVAMEYSLPGDGCPKLVLRQRRDDVVVLREFKEVRDHNIDNTGVACLWPAEEVMAFYATTRPELFRNKRVIELGAGYGLAGLTVASCSEAAHVAVSDANPQVLRFLRSNVAANSTAYHAAKVTVERLHWAEPVPASLRHSFDLVLAADCLFFCELHAALLQTIQDLLCLRTCTIEPGVNVLESDLSQKGLPLVDVAGKNGSSAGDSSGEITRAEKDPSCDVVLFAPRRGKSLEQFCEKAAAVGFTVRVEERYDPLVWTVHERLVEEVTGYEPEHSFPLLVTLSDRRT